MLFGDDQRLAQVINGRLEATRIIRASNAPAAKTIPIIAMTANVFKEDIEKCIDAGMNDHLGKPISIEDVTKLLSRYMKT